MRRRALITKAMALALAVQSPVMAEDQSEDTSADINAICLEIEKTATAAGIPPDFFARLIWKESRFDVKALSPAGAEGIAQFMPGTAKIRGLENSYDMKEALAASSLYLAELKNAYGNLGLAAAAYNAGESRVDRWLYRGSFLPLETEDYVLSITGEPADTFTNKTRSIRNLPIEPGTPFADACRRLPIILTRSNPMANIVRKPWAVQVAGNFKRSAAEKAWNRIRQQNGSVLGKLPVSISRARTAMGSRAIYAVRVGANSRSEADRICSSLRRSGGSCIVMKN